MEQSPTSSSLDIEQQRIEVDYLLETGEDPKRVAEIMAGEQSTGTFVEVPGETPEIKMRSGARVETLTILDHVAAHPSLPTTAKTAQRYVQAAVTLSWPLDNIGPSLPNLLATIAGNLFELRELTGLRILDIRLPHGFSEAYPGPKFGISGTRQLTGVRDGPIIGTIIKPSIGLDPQETAELVKSLCEGGIDFIKDDELQANGGHCPFESRVEAVMRVINAHADRTGKKVMYAFNLTGDLDEMRSRHDLLVKAGATCSMASLNSVGLVGMIAMARHTELPIHAHRNGWGSLSRHPLLGWSYVAWQKIWRLAGADHMHVNGIGSKFSEEDESVIASARACLDPMFSGKPCLAMPVFSSGQGAAQAQATYNALGSTDLMVTAGGAIAAHPAGPGAGVLALRQAYSAAVAGIPVGEYRKQHRELDLALGGSGA